MSTFIIKNIGVLATPLGKKAVSGEEQNNIQITRNCAIGVMDGMITFVGNIEDAPEYEDVIDAKGKLVTPGLVDAHTHLVFGGYRQHEVPLKLKGASYIDILKSGGGILSTVEATRAATKDELRKKTKDHIKKMLKHGTTTIEAKSGYGLDIDTEIKQLSVVESLNDFYNIVPTFMGAHAIPKEYNSNPKGYVDFIINEALPKIKDTGLAEFCDIFTEKSVFDLEDSRKILTAAKNLGFKLKIHADEIEPMGGAGLAANLNCISAEHLLEATDEDLEKMAKAGVIAVLLPATSFYLNKKYARARDMINMGIPVALATDFNPGSSPNFNMQFVLNLAYIKLGMTPAEALTAATLNSAAALGSEHSTGTIEAHKHADIVIWDAPDLDYIFYRYGNNLVSRTILGGVFV